MKIMINIINKLDKYYQNDVKYHQNDDKYYPNDDDQPFPAEHGEG